MKSHLVKNTHQLSGREAWVLLVILLIRPWVCLPASLCICAHCGIVCVCVCAELHRERERPATICRFFGWVCACNQLFIQGSFEIIELTHLSDGSRRNAKRSRRKIPAAPDEPFLPPNSTVITLQQMGSRSFHFVFQVRQMWPARSARAVRLPSSRLPRSRYAAREKREPVVPGARLISVMFCLINSQVQDSIQASGWLVIISFWKKKKSLG